VKGMAVTEVSPKPEMVEFAGSVMSRKSLELSGTAISKPYVNSLWVLLGYGISLGDLKKTYNEPFML